MVWTAAIVTGALSAANQNEWIKFIRRRVAQEHPHLKLDTIQPSDDDRDKAFAETQTIVKVFPGVKLVMAISAPAVPGAAEDRPRLSQRHPSDSRRLSVIAAGSRFCGRPGLAQTQPAIRLDQSRCG